jgi:hypothetical protein
MYGFVIDFRLMADHSSVIVAGLLLLALDVIMSVCQPSVAKFMMSRLRMQYLDFLVFTLRVVPEHRL